MKLLVEHKGQETEIQVGSYIKVIYEQDADLERHGEPCELHLTLTHEGLVRDVVIAGEVISSSWSEPQDLVDATHS